MFGIQPTEFFIILIVALMVLGPERLPVVARKLGRWTSDLRRAADDFRSGLEREVGDLSEITKPVTDLRAVARDVAKDLTTPIQEAMKPVDEAAKSAREAVTKPMPWVGPKPADGAPSPEDAAADLERIEESGAAIGDETPPDPPDPEVDG